MKKTLSIFFVFIFMLQALPVMHWVSGLDKNNLSMEMTDDKDNNEKDNAPKELEKDSKENIIPLKAFYNKQLAHKSVRLALFPSGNAVILHHADVNTPPPDITG